MTLHDDDDDNEKFGDILPSLSMRKDQYSQTTLLLCP